MSKKTTTTVTAGGPPQLSPEASKLHADLLEQWAFDDSASLALLRQLCESLDGIRLCQARVRADGLMTAGAQGQPKPHPLLVSEAEFRRAFLACARALKLTSVEA